MFLLFSSQLRRTAMQFVGENVTGHTLIFVLVIFGLIVGCLLFLFSLFSHARHFLSTLQQTSVQLFHRPFLKKWWGILATHVILWFRIRRS